MENRNHAGPPKSDDADRTAPGTHARTILKWNGTGLQPHPDALAVEEPLEIRLGGRRFTLTMRTPGHDEELAAGFLLAEGFVDASGEIGEIRRVRDGKGNADPNAIDVILNVPQRLMRERLKRNFAISSSCGVCGKTSIESIHRRIAPIAIDGRISVGALRELEPRLGEAQEIFTVTGGLHAAALFTDALAVFDSAAAFNGFEQREYRQLPALNGGELCVIREDVGRHNAVDKAIGHALMRTMLPLARSVLMISGRLSFEIVQKAAVAGIPVVAAISAPSSLAVELADEVGITLVGFARAGAFNVYTHPDRVIA